jgi:hypothetical protein
MNPHPGSKPGTEVSWLSLLTEPTRAGRPPVFQGRVGNFGLPKRQADLRVGTILGAVRNIWEQGLLDPFNKLHSGEAEVIQSSDKALANVFGTPMGSPVELGTLVGSSFMRVENDEENEEIDLPGVEVSGLVLTLQSDLVELQLRVRNRQLEVGLAGATPSASAFLPSAEGGELEGVLELVDSLIARFAAAGLPLNNAPFFQNLAHAEYAQGNFRLAYFRARKAYGLLVKEP